MKIDIADWADGAPIPPKFAFGTIPPKGRFALSANVNPRVAWSDAPADAKSFALICHDPDVPSVADAVNQEGKTVRPDLPRVDFFHWVLVDIPADRSEIAEGEASNGVTPRGKAPGARPYGRVGANSYTQWFAGDADMDGVYADYDGPCPP
ncbi:MAG: YbhB/YbcL family Raf kinase inhibitor-like protein, partial [Pseudomonadota bacterium]